MYGVELHAKTAKMSKKVLKKFQNVEIINKDVLEYFPVGATIIYMYNPFPEKVMKDFVEKLEEYYRGRGGVTIYYFNARYSHCFGDDNWDVRTKPVDGPTLAIITKKI